MFRLLTRIKRPAPPPLRALAPWRETDSHAKAPRRKADRRPLVLIGAILILAATPATALQERAARPAPPTAARAITVVTEPNAVVWLDDLRRGTTNESGRLELAKVSPGRHALRVRARGFAERTLPLPPAQRGSVAVKLVRTADAAELAFQEAEELREKASDEESRRRAVETYRRALTLRPRHTAARVGLARLLSDLGEFVGALEQIAAARAARPSYPEASAVEGRIHRAAGDDEAALAAYRRAVREGRGFQPEAHTGTGLVLQEKGDYAGAAASYRKAVAQLADTEPVVYQLLGEALEREENYKEAVAAYEKYLELAPGGKLAPAIRSVIDQLRKQAAEQDAPPPGSIV